MGTHRQPSEQFLRRLKNSGEPVPPVVAAPVVPPSQAEKKSMRYKRWGYYAIRFLEVLALLFLFPTAYALIVDLEDRQTQRITQAWQLVTQNAPGNSGKIQALEYLNSEDCDPLDDPTTWELFISCGFLALFVPPKIKQPLNAIKLSSDSLSTAIELGSVELPGAVLSYANLSLSILSGANLSGANLRDANLSETIFWRANLSETRLGYANLSGANLGEANLTGAELWGANLSGAKLRGGNLSGADLRYAYLLGADLTEANLSGALFDETYLSGVNFSRTLSTVSPYRYTLTREDLLGADYEAFPWPPDAQSDAFYIEGYPPIIHPSLLAHFTVIGSECSGIRGLRYVECAGATTRLDLYEDDLKRYSIWRTLHSNY